MRRTLPQKILRHFWGTPVYIKKARRCKKKKHIARMCFVFFIISSRTEVLVRANFGLHGFPYYEKPHFLCCPSSSPKNTSSFFGSPFFRRAHINNKKRNANRHSFLLSLSLRELRCSSGQTSICTVFRITKNRTFYVALPLPKKIPRLFSGTLFPSRTH